MEFIDVKIMANADEKIKEINQLIKTRKRIIETIKEKNAQLSMLKKETYWHNVISDIITKEVTDLSWVDKEIHKQKNNLADLLKDLYYLIKT